MSKWICIVSVLISAHFRTTLGVAFAVASLPAGTVIGTGLAALAVTTEIAAMLAAGINAS